MYNKQLYCIQYVLGRHRRYVDNTRYRDIELFFKIIEKPRNIIISTSFQCAAVHRYSDCMHGTAP